MSSFIVSGNSIGTPLSFIISPFLSNWFGWESIFYIFGGIGKKKFNLKDCYGVFYFVYS
jgi:predicted MFS family arabinose efflux permease